MSSSRSSPRSIASRLVFLFTLASAFLLCVGFAALYSIVIAHAYQEDNEVLADKLSAVRADLESASGPAVLREELKHARAGERSAYWVRALDSAGQPTIESPGMGELLPPRLFPAPQDNPAPQPLRAQGRSFALISARAGANGESYTLQIAQDRSEDEQFTRKFAALLVALLGVGILAAIFIALYVTKRALHPLAELTQSFNRVGPKRLDERVPRESWPRELQPLAVAFDEMLDRLEDSFTRLSQFSADLAHELRTPIANLRGESEVALRRTRTPEEYREVIESNAAECERLSGIIDNLLFLARAEAADRPVERKQFDAGAAVDKIIAYYETIAEEHGITITREGAAEIYADPLLFSRAVSNLIDNALRFTRAGGSISVALRSTSGEIEVAVQDDGAGMSAEHLPRVFDRFYRADASRSSEGSGLGLALVKSIMDLHGGSARIESEPGRGTLVRLTFPKLSKAEPSALDLRAAAAARI